MRSTPCPPTQLAALQHIHSLLCIHRDIKADNILIARERKPPSAPYGLLRICDFGLSRIGLHTESSADDGETSGSGGAGSSAGNGGFAVVLGGGRGRTEVDRKPSATLSDAAAGFFNRLLTPALTPAQGMGCQPPAAALEGAPASPQQATGEGTSSLSGQCEGDDSAGGGGL